MICEHPAYKKTYINEHLYCTICDKEKFEFVQVRKSDLEFLLNEIGRLDNYQDYDRQKEIRDKLLGKEG